MARQPNPSFKLYEQSTTAQPITAPAARPQDVSSGAGSIAQSLSRAGAAVQNYQETELDVARLEKQRREDDARVDVARRMADVRRQAGEFRRTARENAPDGWRGLPEAFGQSLDELREQQLADQNLTPEARVLLEDQIYIFEQSALDAVADEQEQARGQWQADTMRSTVDQGGNVLAADPSQYEAMRVDMLETLQGVSDANLRRDITDYMEEGYARFAVSGLIQADPRGTLRELQNPDAEGAYARLSPAARIQAQGQAQAEIDRRHARWVSSVSQSVQSAERMMELGLPSPNAPSVETVRSALGADRALAYEATRAMSTQFGRLSTLTAPQLAAIAGDANPRDNERDAVLHEAERRAAAQILEQRATDPMQYQVRHGLTEPADLIEAFNQNDWGLVNGILHSRSASAQENGARLGMAPLPLTAFEANAIGPEIRRMTAEQRGAFLRSASAWMGRESPAYRGLVAQLFPDSPGTAYAGFITGVAGERGAADAALILRGEDILGGRQGQEGENGTGGRSRLLDMPEDDDLRRSFRGYVGDAYAGLDGAQGNRQAEAQAYEVFRSAYAALAERSGSTSDAINTRNAQRAAQIATGGIIVWNGRETLMVPGMSTEQFSTAVRDGFSRYQQFQGENPRNYNLMPLEATGSGFRYGVFDGDDPVRSPSGRPVEIEVRRRR